MLILFAGLLGLVLAPFLILFAPLLLWMLLPLAALTATVFVVRLVKGSHSAVPLLSHHTLS